MKAIKSILTITSTSCKAKIPPEGKQTESKSLAIDKAQCVIQDAYANDQHPLHFPFDDPYGKKKGLQTIYGPDFYQRFHALSRQRLETMLPQVPDIGDSIFAFDYQYGPCYFAWYSALRELGVERQDALNLIWQINEDFVRIFPRPLLKWFGKNMYLGEFRHKATEAERRGKAGQLHPFDWRIEYSDIDRNTFAIHIYECGMLKLADKFGYRELFPQVCRMDYLFSHYFSQTFKRSGTLADGDRYCDCWYQVPGQCEWAPEKGFVDRK